MKKYKIAIDYPERIVKMSGFDKKLPAETKIFNVERETKTHLYLNTGGFINKRKFEYKIRKL